ncbi:papain family cysteine protease [Teladorsagia circumcincta]|uniref:Papain family cysteine protease n=1 Tax=Teladorsagia circumcincta TaxID=45464 RepID=A0A2G9U352_TELCI|nr:papain family cysteine protease [Teladorsagia circumcincta]
MSALWLVDIARISVRGPWVYDHCLLGLASKVRHRTDGGLCDKEVRKKVTKEEVQRSDGSGKKFPYILNETPHIAKCSFCPIKFFPTSVSQQAADHFTTENASWLNFPSIALRATNHLLSFDKLPEPVKSVEKEQVEEVEGELLDEITQSEHHKKSQKDKIDWPSVSEEEVSEEDESESMDEKIPNMLDEPRESDDEVVVHGEGEESLEEVTSQRKNLLIAPVRRGLLKSQQGTTETDETVTQNERHHRYGGLKRSGKVFEHKRDVHFFIIWIYILKAANEIIDCNGKGNCQGGEVGDVLEYAKTHGLVEEGCNVYRATNGHCDPFHRCGTCWPDSCTAAKNYTRYYVKEYGKPNHIVSVTGWGVDENGVEHWIVRNSWGEEWGEKGWYRVVTSTYKNGTGDEYNMGIERECYYADVDVSNLD